MVNDSMLIRTETNSKVYVPRGIAPIIIRWLEKFGVTATVIYEDDGCYDMAIDYREFDEPRFTRDKAAEDGFARYMADDFEDADIEEPFLAEITAPCEAESLYKFISQLHGKNLDPDIAAVLREDAKAVRDMVDFEFMRYRMED